MTKRECVLALVLSLGAVLFGACGAGSSDSTQEPIVVDVPPGDETPGDETPAASGGVVVGDDPCTTDEDCVPAGCCHPASCGARANAPDCGDVMCTTECRFGTLDCGGSCFCHEGRCAARLSEAPDVTP